ncbi:MAG TPA: hypothetical protein VI160_06160 [Gemmatimonadales bacterium]
MTLDRLALAWLPVALWFWAAGLLPRRLEPAGDPAGPRPRLPLARPLTEAAVLTLFASLWFDSLGHGGWYLLFPLTGVLVAMARRAPLRATSYFFFDVARYAAAGALLAWRLA